MTKQNQMAAANKLTQTWVGTACASQTQACAGVASATLSYTGLGHIPVNVKTSDSYTAHQQCYGATQYLTEHCTDLRRCG